MTPAEWYRSCYPEGPQHDNRCLAVLGAYTGLYNLPITGRGRLDGGFRQCGDGVEIHFQPGSATLATFDFSELTALVIAAHRHAVRLEISVQGRHLVMRAHPRSHDGDAFNTRHPTLDDLIAKCTPAATASFGSAVSAPKGAG